MAALPDIIVAVVEAIPQIIDGIITAVLDSIPLIIQAGIDLLISLVQALPEIITTIVAAIPEIIGSVVNALINSIPQIVQAGVELFISLIANLPTIIVEIERLYRRFLRVWSLPSVRAYRNLPRSAATLSVACGKASSPWLPGSGTRCPGGFPPSGMVSATSSVSHPRPRKWAGSVRCWWKVWQGLSMPTVKMPLLPLKA